jgi:hypothetical protein
MEAPASPPPARRTPLSVRYTRAKAVAAVVGGVVGPALVLLQSAITDDAVTSDEWIKVGIALLVGLTTAGTVLRVPNRRVPTPPDDHIVDRADSGLQRPAP